LVNGIAGAIVTVEPALRRLGFTVTDGRIVEIDAMVDPIVSAGSPRPS
jgi:hypothetical protein